MAVNNPDVGVRGQRVIPLGVTADGKPRYILVDDDGKVILAAGVSVDIGDINIGSVALKDGTGATLAIIKTGETALPSDDALLTSDATAAAILTLIKTAVQNTLDVALDISGDVPVPTQSLPPSSQGLIAWLSKGQLEFLQNSPTETLGDATLARRVVIYDADGNATAVMSGGFVVNTLPLNPLVDGVTAVIDGAGSTELPVADADALVVLTAIDTHVDGVETLLTAVDAHVDGIEGLLASQATAAKQDTAQTTLTAIDGHVDGLEAATGATTDAAVVSDANGSHSGFLRGLVKMLSDIWDSTNHLIKVGGAVAHNVAIAGNPINIAAQAISAERAAATATRLSQLVTDLVGKLIVLPYANPENFVSGTTAAMTGTTSTSLIAAPAAGLRNYITQITVSNSHASVGTDVIIQDGSGGTTLYTIPAAAVYGGAVLTFPTPLKQPTTATALYCANVTTGASTKVSASGYIGA